MILLQPIGYVHNNCTTDQSPETIKQGISVIELLPEYEEGLEKIESCQYLDLIFFLHQNMETRLITPTRTGEIKGIFASRSPSRPNHVGVTTVKLMKREGNKLYVEGSDALNDSPVIDIKCCDTSVYEQENIHKTIQADSPRIDIIRNILSNDTRELMLKASQLHGHICPGLAMGIMGATQIMQKLYENGKDIKNYVLIAEMQNCLVDGFLFVTGCTPGTGRFVIGDPQNQCFYLKDPEGKGWKFRLKDSNREYIQQHVDSSLSPAEKGFATLTLSPEELFEIGEIN